MDEILKELPRTETPLLPLETASILDRCISYLVMLCCHSPRSLCALSRNGTIRAKVHWSQSPRVSLEVHSTPNVLGTWPACDNSDCSPSPIVISYLAQIPLCACILPRCA